MSENTVCFRPQNQCWHLHTIDHSKHYILMHFHTDNSLQAFVSFGFLHQHLSTTFKLTIALSMGVFLSCILNQFLEKNPLKVMNHTMYSTLYSMAIQLVNVVRYQYTQH